MTDYLCDDAPAKVYVDGERIPIINDGVRTELRKDEAMDITRHSEVYFPAEWGGTDYISKVDALNPDEANVYDPVDIEVRDEETGAYYVVHRGFVMGVGGGHEGSIEHRMTVGDVGQMLNTIPFEGTYGGNYAEVVRDVLKGLAERLVVDSSTDGVFNDIIFATRSSLGDMSGGDYLRAIETSAVDIDVTDIGVTYKAYTQALTLFAEGKTVDEVAAETDATKRQAGLIRILAEREIKEKRRELEEVDVDFSNISTKDINVPDSQIDGSRTLTISEVTEGDLIDEDYDPAKDENAPIEDPFEDQSGVLSDFSPAETYVNVRMSVLRKASELPTVNRFKRLYTIAEDTFKQIGDNDLTFHKNKHTAIDALRAVAKRTEGNFYFEPPENLGFLDTRNSIKRRVIALVYDANPTNDTHTANHVREKNTPPKTTNFVEVLRNNALHEIRPVNSLRVTGQRNDDGKFPVATAVHRPLARRAGRVLPETVGPLQTKSHDELESEAKKRLKEKLDAEPLGSMRLKTAPGIDCYDTIISQPACDEVDRETPPFTYEVERVVHYISASDKDDRRRHETQLRVAVNVDVDEMSVESATEKTEEPQKSIWDNIFLPDPVYTPDDLL